CESFAIVNGNEYSRESNTPKRGVDQWLMLCQPPTLIRCFANSTPCRAERMFVRSTDISGRNSSVKLTATPQGKVVRKFIALGLPDISIDGRMPSTKNCAFASKIRVSRKDQNTRGEPACPSLPVSGINVPLSVSNSAVGRADDSSTRGPSWTSSIT